MKVEQHGRCMCQQHAIACGCNHDQCSCNHKAALPLHAGDRGDAANTQTTGCCDDSSYSTAVGAGPNTAAACNGWLMGGLLVLNHCSMCQTQHRSHLPAEVAASWVPRRIPSKLMVHLHVCIPLSTDISRDHSSVDRIMQAASLVANKLNLAVRLTCKNERTLQKIVDEGR